jgi:hypothetical protein
LLALLAASTLAVSLFDAVPAAATPHAAPTASGAKSATKAKVSSSALAKVRSDDSQPEVTTSGSAVPQGVTSRPKHLDPALYVTAGVPGAKKVGGLGVVSRNKAGQVLVTVTGKSAASAARAAGGVVLSQIDGATSVAIAAASLQKLAASKGVDRVLAARKAIPTTSCTGAATNCSEGVVSSQASAWQAAAPSNGSTGAGVKIGIVDVGFEDYVAQATAGYLPSDITLLGNHCSDINGEQHGTAVAEIVHQMAPDAKIYLECISTNVDFAAAENELQAAGVTIVNSSLGFTGDARGDGTGISTTGYVSTALTVKKARRAGILWIQSAGNSAQDHWSGTLADADTSGSGKGWVDLLSKTHDYDLFELEPGASGDVTLTWDKWPSSSSNINISVTEYDEATDGTLTNLGTASGNADSSAPTAPLRFLSITNSGSNYHLYRVKVGYSGTLPALRYDLTYDGSVSPSLLASPVVYWGLTSSDGDPARAAAGSVSEPASSPYVLAVGAAYYGNNTLEDFSSRGPTIDGRVKPDILGYDGTSSPEYGAAFYGTSAAAPHVVGAAALVKSANPTMDAAQIQAFLEQRASPNHNPATNAGGHGLLKLGSATLTSIVPRTGSKYYALANPKRVVDTRTGLGGRKAKLGAGTQITVTPAVVANPATVTAVVINLTGTNADGSTYLSAYPTTFSNTSNVNFLKTDSTAAVLATVPVDSAGNFKVRNYGSSINVIIDVVGYFTTASQAITGSGYAPLTSPTRVLDTRTSTGGHQRQLTSGEVFTLPLTAAPAGATSVIVNITATNQTSSGWIAAYSSTFKGSSSLNYLRYTRANLAVVGLSNGKIKLQNYGGSVDVIVDVLGYFKTSATSYYVPLPSPVRIADTRTGNGGRLGSIAGTTTLALDAAKLNGVPYSATGVWVGVTALGAAASNLNLYPTGQSVPLASTVNYADTRAVSNAAAVRLSTATSTAGQFSAHAGTSTPVVVDLFGYFTSS